MRLGSMQPYFFPYLGYFSLIKATDKFIFFDIPQYERHSWMNRNRLILSNGEVGYITVPLKKAPHDTAIKDIRVDYDQAWQSAMESKMVLYKKRAPYYAPVIELFRELTGPEYGSLAELNMAGIRGVCRYLGMEPDFLVFSQSDIDQSPVESPDDWALRSALSLGCACYINPPGGMSFYDRDKYERHGVKLQFLKAGLPPYKQRIGRFEPGLSVLDALMFNSPEEVLAMLDDYELA